MEKLVQDARELFNVHLTRRQVTALVTYEKELLEWNQKFNLTAIRDTESIRTKHFLDSFSCVLAWKASPPNHLIDVGTGAGFPGIPLKIIYPNLSSACWDWNKWKSCKPAPKIWAKTCSTAKNMSGQWRGRWLISTY